MSENNSDCRECIEQIVRLTERLVQSVTFDDSGINGRGGNGGLLSRETIRANDHVRHAISAYKATAKAK